MVVLSSCQTPSPKPPPPIKKAETEKLTPAQQRYKDVVEDRIGAVWYQLTRSYKDLLSLGTVTITCEIPSVGGKARNVRVTSNTGGRMDLLIALRAIDQLRAPPIPPAVLAELRKNYFELEESFTIYASR
jgi:hypothetical protein